MSNETLFTALIVIIGWIVAHLFTQYREIVGKRQIKRTEYLTTAYRKLENSANRHNLTPEKSKEIIHNIESAIADIHLFGTKKQIELANNFSKKLATKESSSLDSLLVQLREDLRKELRLSKVSREITYLRL